MDNQNIGAIVAIVLLVICSGYFSATETAFTSVNRIKIKNMAGDGNRKAARVLDLIHQYDKMLTSTLIGNNIVNITMTTVATVLFIRLVGDMGATVATIVITVVVLIFGEITPKTLAKEVPEKFTMFAAPFIKFIMVIFTPLNFLFVQWKRLMTKILRVSGGRNITEDELITMVEEAETEGSLASDQSELIQNAIEFNDLLAEEVMTPRVDIAAIDIQDTEEEIAEQFRDTGFSRMPVYEGDLDTILGVLNQKDFHNYIYGMERNVSDFVKPVAYVAGTMKIAALLRKLQAMKTHIAIIVDEYGGTEGLVTMEDIIEELVGEIYDEHDAIMSQEVTQMQNGSYRVICNASLAKVFDFLGIDEEVDANTVNGWVVICLDKLPKKGDTFTYDHGTKRYKGRVTKATDKKALEINIMVEDIPEEEQDENANSEGRK
ncbi:MAG: HlyC/CorC family transporter [Anaerovoracaceae bacterium]